MAGLEEKSAGIVGIAPRPFWNKPIKADVKGIFKAIGAGLSKGTQGLMLYHLAGLQEGLPALTSLTNASAKFVEVLPELVNLGQALSLEITPEEKAWQLVRKAALASVGEIVDGCLQRSELYAPVGEWSADGVDGLLAEQTWELPLDFFDHPREVGCLTTVQEALVVWLKAHQLRDDHARELAAGLPAFFVFHLRDVYLKDTPYYKDLLDWLKSPLAKATQEEQEWIRYQATLEQAVAEPVFWEEFSLEDIFVYLDAKYKQGEKEFSGSLLGEQGLLQHWIRHGAQRDYLRVLCGGPGSGKSSVCKMLASQVGTMRGIRTLYIPLHRFEFDLRDNLADAVKKYVGSRPGLPRQEILQPDCEDKVLLILDGLDEIGMRGTTAREIARSFVEEVDKRLDNLNSGRRRVLAVIAGREIVVQDNANQFRHGKVLYVSPYTREQRDEWWKTYARFKKLSCQGMPSELARNELDALTNQPLLNYLVALSYQRSEVDFSQKQVRCLVYEDLLKRVYERVWGQESSTRDIEPAKRAEAWNPQAGKLPYEVFTALLEQVALAAWHGGDTREARRKDIEERCTESGLKPYLDQLETKTENGLLRLLAAFYFRTMGTATLNDPEAKVEFSHKSFGEYLVARYIVRLVDEIHTNLTLRQEKPLSRQGWDQGMALVEWIKIFGPQAMDFDLLYWCREKVSVEVIQKKASAWQKTLAELLSNVLHEGVPMQLLPQRSSYKEEDRQARNVEESFLILLDCCAQTSGERSEVQWPQENFRHAAWFARLQSHRNLGQIFLHCRVIALLSLSGAEMRGAYLRGADQSGAYLSGANLSGADLRGADLREADLSGAYLSGANLSEADLRGADLSEADLRGADLSEAYLNVADLSGAYLSGAYLSGADLSGADLSGANMKGTENLTDAYGWKYVRSFKYAILEPEMRERLEAIRADEEDFPNYFSADANELGTIEGADSV